MGTESSMELQLKLKLKLEKTRRLGMRGHLNGVQEQNTSKQIIRDIAELNVL